MPDLFCTFNLHQRCLVYSARYICLCVCVCIKTDKKKKKKKGQWQIAVYHTEYSRGRTQSNQSLLPSRHGWPLQGTAMSSHCDFTAYARSQLPKSDCQLFGGGAGGGGVGGGGSCCSVALEGGSVLPQKLFNSCCVSKHVKGSKERYLLGQNTLNMRIQCSG